MVTRAVEMLARSTDEILRLAGGDDCFHISIETDGGHGGVNVVVGTAKGYDDTDARQVKHTFKVDDVGRVFDSKTEPWGPVHYE